MPKIQLLPPLKGDWPLTQQFGENPAAYRVFGLPGHEGLDWGVPLGEPVHACASGVVTLVSGKGAYGLHVKLKHAGFETTYAHLSRCVVELGHTLATGDVLGYSGSSGNSTGPHLHLTLQVDGAQTPGYPPGIVDPLSYLTAEAGLGLAPAQVRVVVDMLNLRLGPNLTARRVGSLFRGDELPLADERVLAADDAEWVPVVVWLARSRSGQRLAE